MNPFERSFKTLEIIFITVLSMQIFIAFALYFLHDMNIIQTDFTNFEYLPLIVLIINTTSILSAKYFFTARNRIDVKFSINEKIDKYRSNSLLIIAVLDFVNIVNIIIYFLTGSGIYLLVALLVLILFIVYRPSKIKFADTSLSSHEKSELITE